MLTKLAAHRWLCEGKQLDAGIRHRFLAFFPTCRPGQVGFKFSLFLNTIHVHLICEHTPLRYEDDDANLNLSWWITRQQLNNFPEEKMNHKDVLTDMLQHFAFSLHRTIADLPKEATQWQPDSEANNIAVTVWHVCRALDVLKVKILEDLPNQKQLWYTRGWAAKTNYDPAGLGIGGFGNLAGYTLEQVKEVPLLSVEEALEYFDQVYEALNDYLTNLKIETLEQAPSGWPSTIGASPDNVYDVLMMFLIDNREHLGEIKAIKAMWKRKYEKSLLPGV